MGARISALLRKAGHPSSPDAPGVLHFAQNSALLIGDAEWELIKALASYPEAISQAAANMDPSRLTAYLYELSKSFSRFYHDCPILNADKPELAGARLALSRAVMLVLQDALNLVCIPFLEAM
jgi:arginyl-tRNA synthetase